MIAASIIPKPVVVMPLEGCYLLSAEDRATWNDYGIPSFVKQRTVVDSDLGSEGYDLRVSPEEIRLSAQTSAGLFYGGQTLRQLIDDDHRIPCSIIRDWPRFGWRGMHLDVSRHFFSVDVIKRYLDSLALHKINRFHWHLTDDQGWRIEIKRYPNLTDIGAWRVNREDLPWNERPPQRDRESADYGGFYTQEQIKDIVAYANERCITVVPEIEMPAHALAALTAYPEYSCTGGPFTVAPGQYWPDTDLFCVGNESTFTFLEQILVEVAELFPGPYVHVGGDEADTLEWERCPKCQQRLRETGLPDAKALQGYFTDRIGQSLRRLNRKLIGWDEILNRELNSEAVVMSWRGTEGGIAAAQKGHDVIMTPASHLYFDHYQGNPETEPKAFGGYSPLSHVYSFEPIPPELNSAEASHILGIQANLWTEYIPTASHLEYMLLPRLAALSEVAWSPVATRTWSDFVLRMDSLTKTYDQMKLNFARNWRAQET